MNIAEVRKVVGRLKSSLFKRANSHSVGILKTNIKGTGLQFKEHQVYTFGDDVRFIDWKILAKTSNPYVKTFDEERNVEIVVVIDASPTMLMGFNGVSKLQAAIEICCLLYLLAKETNDFVHALIITDQVINVPKLSGDLGITQFVSILEEYKIINENGKVNLERIQGETLENKQKYVSIMRHLSRKREIIILSDFNEFLAPELFQRLAGRNNVHCFQILSPLDEAQKIPYSLFASSGVNSSSGLGKYDFSEVKRIEQSVGKQIKKLRIKDKYLESFIKEMR